MQTLVNGLIAVGLAACASQYHILKTIAMLSTTASNGMLSTFLPRVEGRNLEERPATAMIATCTGI